MGKVFEILCQLAFSGSLVYFLLYFTRKTIYRKMNPGCYALLLKSSLLFFMIPVYSVMKWLLQPDTIEQTGVIQNTLDAEAFQILQLNQIVKAQAGSIWTRLFLGIWVTGAAIFLIYDVCGYVKLRKLLRQAVSQKILLENESVADVPVYYGKKCAAPFLTGLFHPRIILPETMTDAQERRIAILHETMHERHHDLWWRAGALLVRNVFWFLPWTHFLYRNLERYGEMACDEAVAGVLTDEERESYGILLLNSMRNGREQSARFVTSMTAAANEVKERLSIIKQIHERDPKETKLHRLQMMMGLAAVMLIVIGIAGAAVSLLPQNAKLSWNRSGNMAPEGVDMNTLYPYNYRAYGEAHEMTEGDSELTCRIQWTCRILYEGDESELEIGLMSAADRNERYITAIPADNGKGNASFTLSTDGIPSGNYYVIIKNPNDTELWIEQLEYEWTD